MRDLLLHICSTNPDRGIWAPAQSGIIFPSEVVLAARLLCVLKPAADPIPLWNLQKKHTHSFE